MKMEKHNILPTDAFIVVNKSIINNEDRKVLNMLYLPIIGPLPIMLYYCLWSCLDKLEIESTTYTHHHLLTNMQLSLEQIVNNREILEAVGLLKTYVKKDVNNYMYELYSPLSPYEFLNHPILNVVLYNNIGKAEYEKIIDYFRISKKSKVGYEDITKKFTEVFKTMPLNSFDILNSNICKYNKQKLNINSILDLNFLISSLPKNLDANRIFTKDNEELIINLAFLYDLDAIKISNILKGCINEKGTINKEDLRKACRNYYEFDSSGSLPTLVNLSQPEYLRNIKDITTPREKMIYTFENTSPYDFLKSKSGDGKPTKRDLKLAESLIIDYGLKPGVVNVLFDYVLKTNNNKLTTSLVETIAGQWSRLKIECVKDAMLQAEAQHKKYKNKPSKVVKNNEHLPEWFNKKIEKEVINSDEVNEIEELLKEYK